MHLKNIQISNFNNYADQTAIFHPRMNALTGKNGMGKTNLLDAVYYLCIGKSYFSSGDKYVIKKGESFFRLFGTFGQDDEKETVEVKVTPGKKKEISLSGKKRDKLSDHIGAFPVVIIAPSDIRLMIDGSEERRKFLDNTVMQFDRSYVDAILTYNKLLKQRNALLKQFSEKGYYDSRLVEAISKGMYAPATKIFEERKKLIDDIIPLFENHYSAISSGNEKCTICYTSPLEEKSLKEIFEENSDRDKYLCRTASGIHKDDVTLKIDDEKLKNFASQGQLKSVILALKMAQYDILADRNGKLPLLLLDDIFDKLDSLRVEQLLTLVASDTVGQVFISDTNLERIPQLLNKINVDHIVYKVDAGQLEKIRS